MKWLEENWLQLHLALAPLGTLVTTWLIWLSGGDGWQWWSNRDSAAEMGQIVPLGAVVYGSLIFAIERLGRMFWALAQREKDIERGRQKGREEGREEGIQKGREEGIEKGREAGFEEAWEKLIQLLAEQNVSLSQEALAEIKDRSKEPPKT